MAVYQAVQEDPRHAATATKKTTNSYTYGESKRIQTDEEGRATAETKKKELEFQIHLPSCPYGEATFLCCGVSHGLAVNRAVQSLCAVVSQSAVLQDCRTRSDSDGSVGLYVRC